MSKSLFHILMFFAMLGWGASWVNIKILSHYINEYDVIFFRYFITVITMIPIIIYLKKSFKIDLKSFLLASLGAVILLEYMKYYYLGTKLGSASLGSALVTTLIPIVTFLMMVALGNKKVTKKNILALLLGATGVLTILNIWNTTLSEFLSLSNIYFLISVVLWSMMTIVSSKATKISPIVFSFYLYVIMITIDAIFFVDFKTIAYDSFDKVFWLNLFIISVVASTFSNTIYFLGIEKLGVSEVSSFIFLVPFSAIGLSILFLKEKITYTMLFGTVLTIIAVKILNNIKLFPWEKRE